MKGFRISDFGFRILAAVSILAGPAWSSEFISPDEIVPGMRGYGLTVFQGTEPETFAVEAVGVMKNRFPKQDLVIILMDHPKLNEANVVAGMSGSPIYFGGRLLGALAYGLVFSKKPIAYVTPIQNMLQELDRPAEPTRPWQRVQGEGSAGRPVIGGGEMKPVSATLAVSGFSPGGFKLLEKYFSPLGMIPVAAGGGDDANASAGPSAFVPGSAVGVQLMSGDLSLTAIGTVTHVDGRGRVLAFGHPFFNIGQTAMPATTAQVHTFVPSSYISYKLASPIRTLGSMVQDRQTAIVIDPTRAANMVPVVVGVENSSTGRREVYRYRVIREQTLTPMLTFMGLSESLSAAEGTPMGDQAFEIRSEIRLSGRENPVILSDVTPSPNKTFFDLLMLLDNPIEEAIPNGFDFDVRVSNISKIAWIKSAQTADRKFRPGDRVPIVVFLRNQRGEEIKLTGGFTLPESIQGRQADIEIRGGFGFSQPEVQPRTLDQVVRLMEKRPKGSDLVTRLLQATPAFTQDGEALPNLPIFFQRILQGGVRGQSPAIAQMPYETAPTNWLILGTQRVQVEIEPAGIPR